MVKISRHSKLYAVAAAVLGVIGAVLRLIELKTVFEPDTGLAMRGQPISILLSLLSVVSIILFFVLSRRLKNLKSAAAYCEALQSKSPVSLVVPALAALGFAAGSVLYFKDNTGEVTSAILMLLGFVTAVSAFMLGYNVYFKKENSANAVFSAIIVLFICLWMVLEYKMRAADPVLLRYVYDFLALCSAVIAFYYKAGFAFDKPRPTRTVFFSAIASYFCLVAMPGASGNDQLIFFCCLALLLLSDLPAMVANLREKEPEQEEERQEEEEKPEEDSEADSES